MSGVQVDNSPAVATRSRDISSWKEEDISALASSEKKRYYRRKSAVKAYFTTEEDLDQIALRYHLPTKMVEKLAKRCIMQHEDSAPWGFRALVPGVNVVDHTPATDTTHQDTSVDATHENVGAETIQKDAGTDAVQEDAINRVPTDPESTVGEESTPASVDDAAPTIADESAPATSDNDASTIVEDATPASVDDAEPTVAHDDEDTAMRLAIVLPQETPSPADDMPDSINIEEAVIEPEVEDKAGDAGETPVSENVSEPVSDVEVILPEEEIVVVPRQPVEPVVVESTIDMDAPPDISERGSEPFYMPELPRKTSRSLVVRGQMLPAALTRASKERPIVTGKRAVIAKRSIRKRWMRNIEHSRKRRSNRVISAVVVAVLFLSLLIPVGAGIAAYSAYNSIKGIALDGVNHLMNVKTLLPASKTDLTAALDPTKLQQADQDFTQAQGDFLQLQQLVNRPDIQSLVQQFAPQYSSKLGMAQHLVQVGIDVTRMGNELIPIAMMGAKILHGQLLAVGATTPLVTTSDISNIEGAMLHCLYYIQDIKTQMSQVSLNQLPISPSQQKEITSAMTLLPKAQSYIEQGQGMIGIVSWLLGIGQQRRFLVQTMDRAELRPSGGFTGQYGVFSIQNGRVDPFTLQDVTELDYNGNGAELGRQAPPGYTSWMNFGNFGLRDANLSGDFPTTARLAMQVFQEEGGGPVDGDIMFTPTAIEHVLDIVGPIKIPEYNDTITAQNLEDKLHYYQNDPAAIALQKEKTNTNNAASRKSFTALVGKKLLDTVRHLPVKTLLKVAQNAQKDIASRDLEIYFSNPQAEAWLVAHNYSGA
ncbi:MAG TPA: DUF4012 domain-containing protein, partial [Ktedonobacteraceae bacterium]|nr:DUF4012 domain-containing protein [Ktedonobacteraceae bacterium]